MSGARGRVGELDLLDDQWLAEPLEQAARIFTVTPPFQRVADRRRGYANVLSRSAHVPTGGPLAP